MYDGKRIPERQAHRLHQNISQARQEGDTETRRADRTVIIQRLNRLASEALEVSFNQLCASLEPVAEVDAQAGQEEPGPGVPPPAPSTERRTLFPWWAWAVAGFVVVVVLFLLVGPWLSWRTRTVAVLTAHNRYVTAMDDADDRDWVLRAETTALDEWEKFELIPLP